MSWPRNQNAGYGLILALLAAICQVVGRRGFMPFATSEFGDDPILPASIATDSARKNAARELLGESSR
jgi:hypothetical protein